MLLTSGAQAAGLGKLTILSALGQPLRAEIEVTAVAFSETGSLSAKLASAEAYRQANIEFNPALASLRFAIEQRGDRHFVSITSKQPVNEPFVDLLLELGANGNKLVREYTFLLDPAESRATQAQVAPLAAKPAPKPVAPPVAAPATPAPTPAPAAEAPKTPAAAPAVAAAAPAAAAAAAAPPAAEAGKARPAGPLASATPSDYTVKNGDSLGRVATQTRPSEVSLDQMLVALFRANPDAFIGKNMNRLRSGQVLTVPDAANVRSVGEGEARSIVVAQATDFNNYRNKLAGQVQQAGGKKTPEAKQSGSGKITTKVEEKAASSAQPQDKLKLSRTIGGSTAADGKAGPAPEDKLAQAGAASDAASRVRELEKNVSELQRLTEIKNKMLAEQKAKAASASTAASATTTVSTSTTASASTAASAGTTVSASTAASTGTTASASASASADKAKSALSKVSANDDLFNSILASPNFLPAMGGGVVALLLGLLGINAYRRRKAAASKPDSEPSDSADDSNSMFAGSGGENVDTGSSVFNSNFAPSASQLDTNEVDPVAEADVYIAYGRDVQAEEILKEALRAQPDRIAVRLKLLEIYAARKDTRLFEAQARELHALVNGEGDDWGQAAAMGLSIDPSNPLYADAPASPARTPQVLDASSAAAREQAEQSADLTDDGADAEAPADEAPAAPVADDNALDFDLGGLSFEPAAAADSDEAAAPELRAAGALDIDEALDSMDSNAAAELETELETEQDAEREAELQTEADAVPELSLEMEPEAAPLVASEGAAATPADDFARDMGAIDFDIPGVAAMPAAPAASVPELDLTDEEAPAPEMQPAPAYALPDIDLDLHPAEAASPEQVAQDEIVSLAQVEMDTKLDLALAYQEIGDKDGARELIDEVLAGGSPAQIEKAKTMRAKLA